jgi:hypothetical protein
MAGLPYAEAVQKFNGLVSDSRLSSMSSNVSVYSKNVFGVLFREFVPSLLDPPCCGPIPRF